LEKIRPYLQIDGGDVSLVKVRQDGIIELKLLGSCNTCPLRPMTLRAGIERALMHEIPGIKRIECFS
jgi:Fe-S cluster biogenesis protein NfuA